MKHIASVVLLYSVIALLCIGCDKISSVNEYHETPPPDPAFELDPVAEPPLKASKIVVLTHSRYRFYDLAKEVAAHHNGAILHVNENSPDSLSAKIRRIHPDHAIVVLPPWTIKPELVASLFHCFGSPDGDDHLGIGYGYITGYTIEDARTLFYRGKSDTSSVDSFLGISHEFDENSMCVSLIHQYAQQFLSAGWSASTSVVSASFASNKLPELRKLGRNQAIFFIGHGDIENSCNISSSNLRSVDLTGDIILAGSCVTGATYSYDPNDDPIALRILNRGATFYVSNVLDNGWNTVWFIGEDLFRGSASFGDAVRTGINREIDWEKRVYQYKATREVISLIIPFGDPMNKPRLKSLVQVSGN